MAHFLISLHSFVNCQILFQSYFILSFEIRASELFHLTTCPPRVTGSFPRFLQPSVFDCSQINLGLGLITRVPLWDPLFQ